jgi:cellulose biosynthesis protein BcsQ
MRTIAVYSVKGGVGKTTIAANLAWSSAHQSSRHTLLWDLDPQGGAGFLFGVDADARARAGRLFDKSINPASLICATVTERLDLLPADRSLRSLDGLLATLGKRKRLARLTEALAPSYDRIILDCPPVLNEISQQIFRAADVIIVPLSPSPLARRALEMIRDELAQELKTHAPILPVFSMIDRRRSLHRDACAAEPDWPVIPMASTVEQMAARRAPLGSFDRTSPAAQAFTALWTGIERKLAAQDKT